MATICTNCKTINTSDKKNCKKCGVTLLGDDGYTCKFCGTQNGTFNKICKNCNVKFDSEAYKKSTEYLNTSNEIEKPTSQFPEEVYIKPSRWKKLFSNALFYFVFVIIVLLFVGLLLMGGYFLNSI